MRGSAKGDSRGGRGLFEFFEFFVIQKSCAIFTKIYVLSYC